MAYSQRGLDKRHEQNQQQLIRDTRTLGQRFADFLKNPESVSLTIVVIAGACFFLPAACDILFLCAVAAFIVTCSQKATLPFRLPKRAKSKDHNNPLPGSNKPGKAEGIYFFGNDKKTNEELWFTNDDMRTHVLMFGSTGSGKTEALVSLAYNALLQSSGFIYVDGKGDNSLFSKVFSMVRSMGREDDLLLINFMTGARDVIGPQKKRLSNTMNPFARGSSSMLAQLVVSLMDAASDSSSGDMWKGRAIAFVEALMRLLVAMRDAEYILLDANAIRKYFTLERIESMVVDKVFIRDGQESISLEGFPDTVLEPITNYLDTLPGYQKSKKGKQVSQVYEQHGFIVMQLTRVFTSLADTYGHIMRTRLAEVDLHDVVLNRRILVVLLPALEKSPDELANLGKIIIASLKAMMAAGLGEEVEGDYADLITRKPTNAKTPFLCILDEYGYYAVPGFAVVPAQARSLGFSVVFAGQDLPALQKASKEEAATIGANTNIKMCMKLEDPLETWDFFMKTAGESYVSQVESFQTDSRSMTNQYMDTRSAKMEKRSRIDLLDLKEQAVGEVHIFFRSTIVRARTFYANPKPVKTMRLNQFVKVDAPSDSLKRTLSNSFHSFAKIAKQELFFENIALGEDSDLTVITEAMRKDETLPLIERGIAALLAYHDSNAAMPIPDEPELPVTELNLFTKMRMSNYLEGLLLTNDRESFMQPMLDKALSRERVSYIERLDGKPQQQANTVAQEIIKDMTTATHYPPIIDSKPSSAEIVLLIGDIIDSVVLKKTEKAAETAGGDVV
ncbi:MAG: TraM recognition domain-containing protein [Gammaproteobacteria bacterium]|nr:TraM recognition domain-containing protein [Gammaproteobacteria bacterium]